MKAKVVYGVKDPTIETDIPAVTSTPQSVFSNALKVLDPTAPQLVALWEKDYLLIGNAFILPIKNAIYDVGFQSGNIADQNGNINATITFVFEKTHATQGVEWIFPIETIAKDFKLDFYNNNVIVNTITRTDNKLSREQVYINIDVFNKIILTITKVNPLQRAKIYDLKFGVETTYDSNTLLSISTMIQTDFASNNVESNEAEFTFYNDRDFNLESIKSIPEQLRQNLLFSVYYISDKQTEMWGKYYSTVPQFSEDNLSVTIKGYDEIYKLGQSDYKYGKVQTRNLYDIATAIATDGGVTLDVDITFKDIVSTGYVPFVPHREALRLVAEASNSIVKADKKGVLSLKPHTYKVVEYFTKDNIIDKSYTIQPIASQNGVNVYYYSYAVAKIDIGLFEGTDYLLNGKEQTFECIYGSMPAIPNQTVLSSGVTLVKAEYFSDRAYVTIKGTSGEFSFITIIGKEIKVSENVVSVGGLNKKEIKNNLITTQAMAESVAKYQLNLLKDKYEYTLSPTDIVSVELGDKTKVQDNDVYVTQITRTLDSTEWSDTIKAVDV